jgi:hypothetical protein
MAESIRAADNRLTRCKRPHRHALPRPAPTGIVARMLSVSFSRRLAVAAGVLLPALETTRRWREWPGPVSTWLPWFDDYILGALLLGAAWLSRARAGGSGLRDRLGVRRSAWLTAGWAFACGAGFGSTLAQLQYVLNPGLRGYEDPSGIAHGWVVLAKATLVSIGLVGLFASMRSD